MIQGSLTQKHRARREQTANVRDAVAIHAKTRVGSLHPSASARFAPELMPVLGYASCWRSVVGKPSEAQLAVCAQIEDRCVQRIRMHEAIESYANVLSAGCAFASVMALRKKSDSIWEQAGH